MLTERLHTGDVREGEVVDFGMNGEGVVKFDAFPVFIPFAIKGEIVKFRITFAKKDFAIGDVIEVLSPSIDRIKPVCPYYMRCGGCDLQHLKVEAQLEIKRLNLERTFAKIVGKGISAPTPISLNKLEYRNKLSLPFGKSGSGKTVLGFYEKKSHKVVPMKFCPLHGEWAANLISALTSWANECGVSVFDGASGDGLLRHVVARMLSNLSLTLVINGNDVPKLDELAAKLNEYFKDYAIFVSTNKQLNNVIMGDTVRLVYGENRKQNLGAFSAEISPLSFLQVNSAVRDAMYDEVCKNLNDTDGDILELYSGVGLLTAELALRLEKSKITAVEIVAEATDNANMLMRDLGLQNRVQNITADAVIYVKKLTAADAIGIAENSGKLDIEADKTAADKIAAIVLDPPRKGCDKAVIDAVIGAAIPKVMYISCNAATLARDVKPLISAGYEISYLQSFDMFPQTSKLETLVVLSRKNPDGLSA